MNDRPLPVENEDYFFLEPVNEETANNSPNPIVGFGGEYKGVMVQFGKIELLIDEDPPRLRFEFAVLNSGKFKPEELQTNADFKNLLGDIIASTIEGMNKNESRDNDSEVADKE